MYISKEPYWFKEEGIKKIEKMYNAIYMGYWCTKHSAGWWNDFPVDVFYQPNPDFEKGHTHYFGIYHENRKVYITNAESAFSQDIFGVPTEDGEVIVSRYRHDCVVKEDHMIDGGREYLRHNSNTKLVKITVDGPNFLFSE